MDQRDAIQKMTDQIKASMVDETDSLALKVTQNYDTIMGQALEDLNRMYESTFGGNGQLNYTDYKRMRIDELQLRMIQSYKGALEKKTIDDIISAMESMYLKSYQMNAWALDQATPPKIDIATIPNMTANPATDFYLQTFLKNQVVTEWKGAMFSQRLGVINNKMARNIQSITDAGMVNGWSTQQLGQVIRDEVGIPLGKKLKTRPRASAAKMRADMIARAEMMRSADLAKQYLYSQNKNLVEDERWLTSDLGNVCDECDMLGEADDGKGALLSQVGRPPKHPRCACTGVPVLVSWGKLLGKDYEDMKDESIDEWEMKHPDPVEPAKFTSVGIEPFSEWIRRAA